ncbi:MAG: branched-chain amino acid ABC transporter permease, partial [Tateyamaria sp.]
FVLTVMFFPGGLAGLIMMHVPAMRLGKLGRLGIPYLKTLGAGAIGRLGAAALIEMTVHLRHASAGDHEMTVYWTTFDSHSVVPWIIAIAVTGVGFAIARRTAPGLVEAWNDANTPDGATR